MSSPVGRPIWDQHPLWVDRGRLEAINQRMWFEIQKVMFPHEPRRPLQNPGRTELALVGGISAEDAYSEAVHALLQYEPKGDVNWEALAITIARRRAIAAVRKATKHRSRPDGSETDILSLDLEDNEGNRFLEGVADPDALTEDDIIERVLRNDRLLAFRGVADEILPQRDRDILFRRTRGETNEAIAQDVGLSGQRVGQIYRESLRKINARLRGDPKFRQLYEPEGGNPHD